MLLATHVGEHRMPRWSTWKQHEGEVGMPRALDNLRDFSNDGFDMCCHPTEGMVLADSQSTASVLILHHRLELCSYT